MPSAIPKDPAKVAAGRAGALKRWAGHDARSVAIHDLTPEQRRLVAALIAAARSASESSDAA